MSLPQAGIVRYNMCFCAALLIFCAPLATPTATLAQGIIGKDQRQKVPSKYADLAAGIGLLVDSGAVRSCSAFCVAKDVIVTNAHCLVYNSGRNRRTRPDVRDSVFLLFQDGTAPLRSRLDVNYVGKPGAPEISVLSGEPPGRNRRRSKRRFFQSTYADWAVARLKSPVCANRVLRFAGASLVRNTKTLKRLPAYLIGFHGDYLRKQDYRPRYSPCRIRQIKTSGRRRIAYHNCDLMKGASGSPIFVDTSQGPRVVAVVTGSYWYRQFRRYRSGRTVTTKRWSTNLAVLPLEFMDKIERFGSVRFTPAAAPNDTLISTLQQKLKAGGYYKARVDNDFGPKTKAALMRFERAAGLVPLGLPTADLLDRLDTEQRDTAGTAAVSTSSTRASND